MQSHEIPTSPQLTFNQLGCSRGGRHLFSGVECELHAGSWLYVSGANGVGKTSLLRMVCGLTPVEFGDIRWNGVSIDSQRDLYAKDLCYLGHLNALQESMTVNENIVFAAALGGYTIDSRQIRDLLGRLGVAGRGEQLVRHLSQGQRRRVALSRLTLSSARLWVLDEPFVAMDESGIGLLAALITEHLSAGGLAVVTSHQQVRIGDIPCQVLELHG